MPHAKDGFRVWFAILAAFVVFGCGSSPAPPYPKWSVAEPSTAPSDAFTKLLLAADEADLAGKEAGNRVYFDPKQKTELIAKLAPAIQTLASVGPGPIEFAFHSRGPFEPPKGHRGWWLIGQALQWRIERAIVDERFDSAVADVVLATRLGYGLMGGSAIDASLGLSIVDMARKAILLAMSSMGAAQLQKLADGLQPSLTNRHPMSAVVHNERLNMLRAVDEVQSLYRDNKLKELSEQLGSDVSDAVDYLDKLHAKDVSKRPEYFEGFAAEAEETSKWLGRLAALNASQRKNEPPLKLAQERPWWRFAKHFFGAVQPLFGLRDATIARTKLLILNALIMRQVKVTGVAPHDLHALQEDLVTDPYSGRPFLYRPDGADFKLYSVGEDLKDDGGDTNESFESPDLTLER